MTKGLTFASTVGKNTYTYEISGGRRITFTGGVHYMEDRFEVEETMKHPNFLKGEILILSSPEEIDEFLGGEFEKITDEILDSLTIEGILALAALKRLPAASTVVLRVQLKGLVINPEVAEIISKNQIKEDADKPAKRGRKLEAEKIKG